MQPWPSITGLYDRFPLIGELIYGPQIRGKIYDEWTQHEQALMHHMAQFYQIRPLVVFCLPSWETVAHNMGQTAQPKQIMALSQKRRQGIYWAYWSLFHTLRANKARVVRYDYTLQSATYPLGLARELIAMYGRGHEFQGRPRVQEIK